MRIISKFRDYYDGVRAYGIDPLIVYVRRTEELKELKDEKRIDIVRSIGSFGHLNSGTNWIRPIIVSFCGKVYLMYEISYLKPIKFGDADVKLLAHTTENLKIWLEKFGYDHMLENWNRNNYTSSTRMTIERLTSLDTLHVHIKYKVPVIVIHDLDKVTLNPNLRKLEFAKHVPPFDAFQKISMFLGGLAPESKPMPVISDELKAQSKGFDKMSFRKYPTKHFKKREK